MDEITIWRMVDRLKIELAGRGLSLRKIDAMLPPGKKKRHRLQRNRGRSLPIEDILEILEIAEIDAATFFGQVAGYGHPLEIAALRGVRKARWTKRQARILAAIVDLEDRGGAGYEAGRQQLRQLECLRDENPEEAELAAWSWLEREKQPGVVVGLLSFLAIAAPRSNAHHLLQLAISVLGGALRSAAGARLATAAGRCFTQVGEPGEGLAILENFALSIVAIFGDQEDHAIVLFHLANAAAKVGKQEVNLAALRKAAEIGSDHLRFCAAQLLAAQELNVGDVRKAALLYDDLVEQAQFERETKRARITVSCSRLTAHFLAGDLPSSAAEEFRSLVAEAKEVLSPRYYISVAIDLALFLESINRATEARRLLELELWNAVDLDDSEVQHKFAGLWRKLGLPQDTRFHMLVDRAGGNEPRGTESSKVSRPAHRPRRLQPKN